MCEHQYICECKAFPQKRKKPPREIKFFIPIVFCLSCEYPSIIEIYDSKITVDSVETKMLDTVVVLTGTLKIILYYFSVDKQLLRVEFCKDFVENVDLQYYYRGIPELLIKRILSDFRLVDLVSDDCKSLGYQKVKGQVMLKGFLLTPKYDCY